MDTLLLPEKTPKVLIYKYCLLIDQIQKLKNRVKIALKRIPDTVDLILPIKFKKKKSKSKRQSVNYMIQ